MATSIHFVYAGSMVGVCLCKSEVPVNNAAVLGFEKAIISRKLLRILFPFASVAVIACLFTGYVRGTLNLTWHIIPILIVYPIWGTIQQFLCVGLVAGNFQDMNKPLKKYWIVPITAVLFSVLHYPNLWLMMGTFILAILYTIIYLRERNLYALGLFHGWLGALFYYTVVGRDPFMEVFGQIAK